MEDKQAATKTITINVPEMHKFLRDETRKAVESVHADADEFKVDTGMHPQAFLGMEDLGAAQATFCELWPNVNKLIKYAGWIPGAGGIVAKVKPVIAWLNKFVVPQICAAEGKPAPTVKDNITNN